MLDLTPATQELTRLVRGVRDDQLGGPTPCPEITLGALLDHVDGLAVAFAGAAAKQPVEGVGGIHPDATRLDDGFRDRIAQHLEDLAAAWQHDDAWSGMTRAGGVDMPGEVAGLVALDEVVVHGWDIARASGQELHLPDAQLEGALAFVQASVDESPEGTPGLFGPPVPVPDDAPLLDRLIGLTGRDPHWKQA